MRLPRPGEVVAGKYRIQRELGRGGMGVVFEVAHELTYKRLAIKWLLPALTLDPAAVKRFQREAVMAARFEHPHALAIHDFYAEADGHFLVMELLAGESLATRLRRVGRLAPEQACRLLVPCLDALAEGHEAGIVHRDLKPANIFLCQARGRLAEHAKILDFGISRWLEPPALSPGKTTASGSMLGTPWYMAPEIAGGKPFDHRVDIYAMAVTLYEALAGRRPFAGESWPEVLAQILRDTPAPLAECAADLPAGLADVVARGMARDPEARFASAEELAHALEACVARREQSPADARSGDPQPSAIELDSTPPMPDSSITPLVVASAAGELRVRHPSFLIVATLAIVSLAIGPWIALRPRIQETAHASVAAAAHHSDETSKPDSPVQVERKEQIEDVFESPIVAETSAPTGAAERARPKLVARRSTPRADQVLPRPRVDLDRNGF